jgi:DNA repair protein RadD
MQLRPRQADFVKRCLAALAKEGNTLGIAPTGAGKTVMLSAVLDGLKGRSLVLQHRIELVNQNKRTYLAYVPGATTAEYTADEKTWSDGVTFGMVQTLCRDKNLATLPKLDTIVIDECHHVAADSYQDILAKAREVNPKLKVFGVTATPERGDRKALGKIFSNTADQITLPELIESGHLVKPRCFVIDCDIQEELSKVKATIADFDMEEVASIMDKEAITDRVIEEWKKNAGDRQTVIFCSTIEHADHVHYAFTKAGVSASIVHSELQDDQRALRLDNFDKGKTQVMVNVAVLTEGWDCQTVSCVVLLRPCSYKSTMIQMVGRGLRKVDPERYPGVIKDDCVVLDFGYSLLSHGSIEVNAPKLTPEEEVEMTVCTKCGHTYPARIATCPACQAEQEEPEIPVPENEREALEYFAMREVHLIDMSPYRWISMFDGMVLMANGMTAWVVIVNYAGRWWSVGGIGYQVKVLGSSPLDAKIQAIATCDDFLRVHGDASLAGKNKRWLHQAASEKQLAQLGLAGGMHFSKTKYQACCEITWMFNEKSIERTLKKATT